MPVQPGLPSGWKDGLEVLRDGLIVAGLLVYGVVRISEDAFYGTLGTSPEEVGVSYVTTLARAASILMLVGFGLVTAFAIMSLL